MSTHANLQIYVRYRCVTAWYIHYMATCLA